MRRLAGFALAFSALFLAIVAILSDAPALFYMGTALLATIGTARFQAYLSVRGLRFERYAPELARIGERVKVEIVVWSERNIRRPLVFVNDLLPPRFMVARRGPSLPIAPDFAHPVRTEYSFRPRRRGIYRWSGLEAVGTDALGLVSMSKVYSTDSVELTVLPVAIPLSVELPAAAGWGVSEASSGENKGPSGEPRGIREYKPGDSLRHVHWRTSARVGKLHVKEFEAGSHSQTSIFLQRTQGTDLLRASDAEGQGPLLSSLDQMAGQALFLSENLLRQGAKVDFPQFEASRKASSVDRRAEISLLLAGVQATSRDTLGEEVARAAEGLQSGSLVVAFVVRPDSSLTQAITRLRSRSIQLVVLLYDAAIFTDTPNPKRQPVRAPASATDASFSETLRTAGAYPVTVPALSGAPV